MTEGSRAPLCPRCHDRHLPELPCWGGDYRNRVAAVVLDMFGDTCCHCGLLGAASVEHLVPRSYGGTDHLDNLLPAHLVCNQRRGRKPWGRPPTPYRSPRWQAIL